MSRRHKRCQYCGAELPEHLLATAAEIEADMKAWKEADKERQKRQTQADAVERANRAGIDLPTIGLGGF